MRRIKASLAAVAWALLVGACASPVPDTVFFNGKIFTANPAQPWAEALAIRGERIVAADDNATVTRQAGSSTRRIDLGGRAMVPGFNDAHVIISGATPETVMRLGAEALARGVTSIQVLSAGPVAVTIRTLRDADVPLRARIIRMPVPDPSGGTRDSRPFFPPRPGRRLDARGMAFVFGAADGVRLQQAVGWAYGSEDPLLVHAIGDAAIDAYLTALEQTGRPEVWRAKRPRIEHVDMMSPDQRARVKSIGAVVVQKPSHFTVPEVFLKRYGAERAGWMQPMKSLVEAGVPLAIGSDGPINPFLSILWGSTHPANPGEALTREQAVSAYTRGSAFAEFTEREKGQLAVGMLADLAVLSADVFTVPPGQMESIRSVLTMIGGRTVHDTGAVR